MTSANRAHVGPFAVYRLVKNERGMATPEQIAETTRLPLAEVRRTLRAKGWPHSRPDAIADADQIAALDFT